MGKKWCFTVIKRKSTFYIFSVINCKFTFDNSGCCLIKNDYLPWLRVFFFFKEKELLISLVSLCWRCLQLNWGGNKNCKWFKCWNVVSKYWRSSSFKLSEVLNLFLKMQTLLPKKPFLQKNKICKTPGWYERGCSFNIF